MNNRLLLQSDLERILGTRNVYFQPPESIKLKYPAIVYQLSGMDIQYSNDGVYKTKKAYTLILIDPNPDTPLVDVMKMMPLCRFNTFYQADNLNHYVFSIYY